MHVGPLGRRMAAVTKMTGCSHLQGEKQTFTPGQRSTKKCVNVRAAGKQHTSLHRRQVHRLCSAYSLTRGLDCPTRWPAATRA
eukprot:278381-Chlamydomonas_euryale.AAC.18